MSSGGGHIKSRDDLIMALGALVHDESYRQIGEVAIDPWNGGGYQLYHYLDRPENAENIYTDPSAALEIRRYDAGGEYRPLQGSPSLRQKWRLDLENGHALLDALDFFYPMMVANFLRHRAKELRVTPVLDTMRRQTGMYRRVAGMTPDQVDELTARVCHPGNCLRTAIWPLDHGVPVRTLPGWKLDPNLNITGGPRRAIPLLCSEICNLLVAKGREYLKEKYEAEQKRLREQEAAAQGQQQ